MNRKPPTALITGCRSGIGKHLALTFAAHGITVLATARQASQLSSLCAQNENIHPLPLDLDDPSSIDVLAKEVEVLTGGHLDYLVNNAGLHYAATAMDMDVQEAAKVFGVNVFSVMRLCQVFMPFLRNARGTIVQIGSVTRDVPVVWQGAYNASKAALSQYTRTLRLEVKPFGVNVVEVVTGFVQSDILRHGLYAPDTSLYLPIKERMEEIKLQGNRNGMPAHDYAGAIVRRLVSGRAGSEIWQGGRAFWLRVMLMVLPRWLLDLFFYRHFGLNRLRRV